MLGFPCSCSCDCGHVCWCLHVFLLATLRQSYYFFCFVLIEVDRRSSVNRTVRDRPGTVSSHLTLGQPHGVKTEKPQQMHVSNENQTQRSLLCLLLHRSFCPAEKSRMYRMLCLCVGMAVWTWGGVYVCLGGVGGFYSVYACMCACESVWKRESVQWVVWMRESDRESMSMQRMGAVENPIVCTQWCIVCLFVSGCWRSCCRSWMQIFPWCVSSVLSWPGATFWNTMRPNTQNAGRGSTPAYVFPKSWKR